MPILKPAIPVLMYHHINNFKRDLVTITPEDFEKQIKFLSKSDYKSLFLSDVHSCVNGTLEIQKKTVAITFDDGFLDNWIYAFPILKKYNVKATIFISTSWLTDKDIIRPTFDDDSHLPEILNHKDSKKVISNGEYERAVISWAEARKMYNSGLIDFQSHTSTHIKITYDTNSGKIFDELIESKRIISEKLNNSCDFLAWPWGRYNDNAVLIAKKAGYKGIFTVERGSVNKGDDPFFLKRIVVKRGDLNWFKKRMFIYSNALLSKCYLKVRF